MSNNKKNVSIIGTVGIPANYGGFETLVDNLTKKLNSEFNLTVYCSSKSYNKKLKEYNNSKLIYLPIKANGIQSILYDIISIFHALLNKTDVLLILGVSGCIILPLIRLITKKKIIINIDGLEWKRNKWNYFTKKFLKFSEKLAVNYANYVIADNIAIQKYISREYNKLSIIVEYGGSHTKKIKNNLHLLSKFPFLNKKYAISVCRVEPENNLHIILSAFSKKNDHEFVAVGNWNISKYSIDLYNQYKSCKNIHLLSPIYKPKVINLLRGNASTYIHGHSAGGTNPSLVEAMYLKLPIIAFNVIYNRETTDYSALYFKTEAELSDLIAIFSDKERTLQKETMYSIAQKRYKWSFISKIYKDIINLSCPKKEP